MARAKLHTSPVPIAIPTVPPRLSDVGDDDGDLAAISARCIEADICVKSAIELARAGGRRPDFDISTPGPSAQQAKLLQAVR